MQIGDLVIHEMWGLAIVFKRVSPYVDRWWIRVLDEKCHNKNYTCWASNCEIIKK